MGLWRSLWLGVLACCLVVAAPAAPDLDAALAYAASRRDAYVSELSEIVALPSVSAQPERLPDLLKASQWVKARLEAAGLQNVQILDSSGSHPSVYGEHISDVDGPTILIYGHYDVQPAEPLEKWTSPAFELTEREGRLYGRGASDDKGGILAAIQGVEAVLRNGGLRHLNVKFLVEGGEEVLSPQLEDLLARNAALLRADAAYSADGGQAGLDRPSLTLGYRGAIGLEVGVTALAHDVHSGAYGGVVQNAARALVLLLGSLFDGRGGVVVPGFYDGVRGMTEQDAADVEAYGFDERAELVHGVGALSAYGEPEFSPLARLWFRPTLEIVGIYGGYTGRGMKTIVPAAATAKLAARLVPDQDPAAVFEAVAAHLRSHAPPACNLTVRDVGFSAMPYVVDRGSRWVRAAARVLETLAGVAPVYDRSGATIPALAAFRRHLGIDTVSFAFSTTADAPHAPDESFSRAAYDRAREAYVRLLHDLDGQGPAADEEQEAPGGVAHDGAGELPQSDSDGAEELPQSDSDGDEARARRTAADAASSDGSAQERGDGAVYEEEAWAVVPEHADELGGDWVEAAYEHEEL